MKNVGRIVIAWDGFEEKEGQIIADYKDRFGDWYLVAFEDGRTEEFTKHSVTESKQGIGIRFASPA
jgi:hypothetical protein